MTTKPWAPDWTARRRNPGRPKVVTMRTLVAGSRSRSLAVALSPSAPGMSTSMVDRLAWAHPEDARIAAGGAAEPQDHVDRRRLARAVRAQEGDDLSGADGQVGAVNGGDVTEGLVQIGQADGVDAIRLGNHRE